MTTPTRLSSPSNLQSVDAQYSNVLGVYKRLNSTNVGAGQKATIVHGLEIERLNARWGQALFPEEPTSMMVASLMNEMDDLSRRMRLWEVMLPDPAADRIIEDLGYFRFEAATLMDAYLQVEVPTEYTHARDAESLELLMTPVAVTTPLGIDYKAIKDAIDIVEYIGRFSPLRRTGAGLKARCPIHDDVHPSMHIYTKQKRWWCFVCGTGGDVIDYERARTRNDRALPR